MKTILIIEDEPQMLRNIATLLKLEGYQVLAAQNGRLGVEAASQQPPDLILCDISMPEMDGFWTITEIRKLPNLSAVPFIFLTARGDPKDVRTGMNLGADDYLPKPFSVTDLISSIEARFHRVQAIQHAAEPIFESAVPLEKLGLTPSEASVLLWMAQGKSNAEIASILGNSVSTVKKHAQHIFDKLGLDNRASAMLVARDLLSGR